MRSQAEIVVARELDALGVEWEYEKHVVALRRYGWIMYLPDFYLPGLGVWIEVKGPEPSRIEKWKCRQLAKRKRQNVYCVWDYGDSCMLFRPGKKGVLVGGLFGRR